ncbi:MAG: TIGR02996 domain-containing protein [Myxococcales bacterium]|nr:TIGR02996 domain-containing protein [Myxococcales bacterium]
MIEELLAAIRDDADDDAPRLVYADWLAEQGDPRGDLVRVQVARAQLPSAHPDRVRREVEALTLLDAHETAWRRELPAIEGVTWGAFERGFVQHVGFADVQLLVDHADVCQRATPLHRIVVPWPRFEGTPSLPAIPSLRTLTVHGTLMRESDVDWLAHSPLLGSIRSLILVGYDGSAEALGRLLASPHLSELTELGLPHHALGDDAIRAVIGSGRELQALDLSQPGFTELGSDGSDLPWMEHTGELLAAWPGLAHLRRLGLAAAGVGPAFLSAPAAAGLVDLDLLGSSYYSGGDWLLPLADAHPTVRLRRLRVGMMKPTSEALRAVSVAPCLAELEEVILQDLWHNWRGPTSIEPLLGAPWLDTARILRIGLDDQDFLAGLAQQRHPQLHTLDLACSMGPWAPKMEEPQCQAVTGPAFTEILELRVPRPGPPQALGDRGGLDQLLLLEVPAHFVFDPQDGDQLHELASSALGQRVPSRRLRDVTALDRAARRRRVQLSSLDVSTEHTSV